MEILSRGSTRPTGPAESDGSLRSLRFVPGSRLIRRRSRTEERVRSLLLTTAAGETR
jgi:hypothetical protein